MKSIMWPSQSMTGWPSWSWISDDLDLVVVAPACCVVDTSPPVAALDPAGHPSTTSAVACAPLGSDLPDGTVVPYYGESCTLGRVRQDRRNGPPARARGRRPCRTRAATALVRPISIGTTSSGSSTT